MATFSLFTAYILSPRRFRHPYLLYTSVFAFASGLGVDYGLAYLKDKSEEAQPELDLEAQGDEVNGEQVRQEVEKLQFTEAVRTGVSGFAFFMGVIGIWGDGV